MAVPAREAATNESSSSSSKPTDFPKPLVNTHVLGIEVDCVWPDLKLVAEIDGPGHARPRTQREDRAVDAALQAAGYTVLRGAPREVLAALLG